MDSARFDGVTRLLATRRTRRTAVASGIVLAAAMGGRVAAQDATPTDCPTLTAEEMEAQVTALVDAWNSQDIDQLEATFHPDHAHHWNGGTEALGLDDYLAAMSDMWEAFDNLTVTADDIITAGDVAVLRLTISGTQVAEFNGFPPGDQPTTWTAIMILTFRCGLIVEARAEANHLGRLQQQGSIPAPGLATPAS